MRPTTLHLFSEFPKRLNVNRRRLFLTLTLLVVGLAFAVGRSRGLWLSQAAAGNAIMGVISGTVFQDYNANGARDANTGLANAGSGDIAVGVDQGISGVFVIAYLASGEVAGTATTDGEGNYSLNASGAAPYRVEFTTLPNGFRPGPFGPDSRTPVQFVSSNNASNVSLGLVVPEEYCQNNPVLVTGCYVGDDQNTDSPGLITFPYSAGSTRDSGAGPYTDFDQPPPGVLAKARQVGTTWGIGYSRSARQLYVSAFMKKHAGFGPAGTGAIYKIDLSSSAVTVYADLNAIFGAGAAGANLHDNGNFDTDNGNTGWDAVGKNSLGGMAVSDDGKKLYLMNLADRELYELPLDAAPDSSNIRRRSVPLNPPGCANSLDVRPFAVNFSNFDGGKIYVGMVCSAESTITQTVPDGDAGKLQAYVYSVNPATLEFSASPVFQMALDYPRRCADSAQLGPGNCFAAAWRAWSPVYRNIGTSVGVGPANLSRGIYPQPMLTDLAFDRGNLILGFRDRAGDQFGNATLDNPAENLIRYYGVGAGDTLRACGDPTSGWTLERNGRCGGVGTSPQNSGEGPGGGEYYFRDESPPFTDEIFLGGMLQIPGFPDLAANALDPIPIFDLANLFDGGVRWQANDSGGLRKSYRIYNGDLGLLGPFGKANGLSDLVALCDPAPIEIGNRVWRDDNGNGIQDANEAGLNGVRVLLFKNGGQAGETTTGTSGEFYFNSSNVSGGLLPAMEYEIRVAQSQMPLIGLMLTKKDADGTANGDSRDSDAATNGINAVITLTTGAAGETNHTFDIGFQPPQPMPTPTPMMPKSSKCDTICFRAPQYYLLNLDRLPRGTVLIGGINNNQPVSSSNTQAIALALRGRVTGTLPLTSPQRLNQEFVAAQLSINAAGGAGSPVAYNAFWSMLGCYQISFAPVTLSNGAAISPNSMLNDLFQQSQLAILENRTADMNALAAIFDLLNGNDPLGRCGR